MSFLLHADIPLVEGYDYIPFMNILSEDGSDLLNVGRTDDGCSNLTYLSSGFPLGSRIETELRVSYCVIQKLISLYLTLK